MSKRVYELCKAVLTEEIYASPTPPPPPTPHTQTQIESANIFAKIIISSVYILLRMVTVKLCDLEN